jgi:hypothetical protein
VGVSEDIMVLQGMAETDQQTKDNLGARDTTKDQTLFRVKENLYFEEGPTFIEKQNIESSFILGHSTNGVLGTGLLGDVSIGAWTIVWVVNPNNIFHEHFRDNFFYDSSSSSNVTWDTTSFRIEFSANGTAQTNSIFYNDQEIATVKVTVTKSGLKVTSQINESSFPGGRQVNLT